MLQGFILLFENVFKGTIEQVLSTHQFLLDKSGANCIL
jgi:hypothetical protein